MYMSSLLISALLITVFVWIAYSEISSHRFDEQACSCRFGENNKETCWDEYDDDEDDEGVRSSAGSEVQVQVHEGA